MAEASPPKPPAVRKDIPVREQEAPVSSPPVKPTAPQQEIKKPVMRPLDKQLDDSRLTLEKAEKLVTNTKDEIKAMEKACADVAKASDTFVKGWKALKSRKDDLMAFFSVKRSNFESLGEDAKADILSKVQEVDRQIADGKTELAALEKDLSDKEKFRFNPAQKVFDDRRIEFDAYKDLLKRTDDKLKEVENLKKAIEAQDKAQNPAAVYYLLDAEGDKRGMGSLLRELVDLIRELNCFTVQAGNEPDDDTVKADIKRLLENKWQAFHVAEKQFSEANDDRAASESRMKTKKDEVDKLEKSRDARILEVLKDIKL